MFNYF